MSRQYYDDYGDSPIPDYYTEQPPPPPRTNHQSRIPRPEHAAQDPMRSPPQMRPDQYHPAAGPSPRRAQEQYYPDQSAWDASQHLYDGSGYVDEYGQYDQWPLPVQAHTPSPRNSPRRPPQRPQRPDESPQRPDHRQPVRDQPRSSPHVAAANRQYHAPPPMPHHGSGQWNGDGYDYAPPDYPPPNRPLPQSRGPIDPQSAIPQYAPPQIPQQAVYGQANRRPPLGPPPSARKGPPSYYPASGPVHPIVEETDSMRGSTRTARTGSAQTGGHDSKNSFASSNAIPIGIPQFYIDNGAARPSTGDQSSVPEDFDDDSSIEAATGRRLDKLADRDIPRGQPSPEVLVRQASVGKKSKPTLTTVKSGDRMRKVSGEQGLASLPSQQERRAQPTMVDITNGRSPVRDDPTTSGASADDRHDDEQQARNAAAVAAATEYMHKSEPTREGAGSRTPEEILRSGTGLLDPSSSDESEREVKKKRSRELLGSSIANELHPTRSRARSPLAPDNDERVKSILESLEKGGAISAKDAEELKAPTPGLSERAGRKRPPRLNVDAVRDAEARGSLTSLPDLIRRATKLASNLDRGKTASRMGMANWLDGAEPGEKRRSGSVSDILNSFPAPHNQTPHASRGDMSRWSSRLRHSALPSDSDAGEKEKPRRKCCGMPLWLFLLLLLLLVLLVAAAVIVPIMLVVVPKQNSDHKANTATACEKKLTCENGGTNILSNNGFCECLCINGYTGLTCSNYEQQSCTTASIGSANNATVGDAIPRLLSGSNANFSIPLDGQQLLGLFSSSDMSCTSQNALVTFNGASSKHRRRGRRSYIDVLIPRTPTPTLDERQQTSPSPTATSSIGIVYADGSPSSTSSSSAPTSTSTTSIISTPVALDFARIAVLYVFQAAGDFNSAATAQENLQDYFRQGDDNEGQTVNATNVSLGNGFACDLRSYTVVLANGSRVGGNGGGSS
ncbi:hypothetical protein M409DRAFT_70615 [Zasmidium cellare ATCC 36951]|uniref:EGF-like domain-containing protein n=1 Tax=Zasmidium cellare ATCC 36951 TaxID=1080233 RepID=A0A6A6C282_ZASCE|nr:uncharacterized protein M409DRAFT_70615 [Zasmidium cellare ATCC 36951]KAF2160280.1 hypothetical protein M409DRAFT_70615 [Zasmidium cellare ATCC 36951]